MANALYDSARNSFLKGEINWLTDTIRVVLVDTDEYAPDLSVDEFLSSIPLIARIATSAALDNKTAISSVANSDDVLFTSVSGPVSEAVIIYKDTGNASTSTLIAYIDQALGLPITPNGDNIILSWSNGPNKIFRL